MDIDEFVALSVNHNVTDLHLCPRQPARWRRQGRLEVCQQAAPAPSVFIEKWLTGTQRDMLVSGGQVDFALTTPGGVRLRGHAFKQYHGDSLALRFLPACSPSLSTLGIPAALIPLLLASHGLILISGATGSGKTTTLAAMVEYQNQHRESHIVTLEDPIEYIHTPARCLIHQREPGLHCQNYAAGLKAALREDPDIIVLGELRDAQTIRLALNAAETGHLVMATLHTAEAVQALERIIDVFPCSEQIAVRTQLSRNLKAVLAQQLRPTLKGGRVVLFELLLNTPAIANMLREGKLYQLPGILQTGQQLGMQSFAQSVSQRIAQGIISADSAAGY